MPILQLQHDVCELFSGVVARLGKGPEVLERSVRADHGDPRVEGTGGQRGQQVGGAVVPSRTVRGVTPTLQLRPGETATLLTRQLGVQRYAARAVELAALGVPSAKLTPLSASSEPLNASLVSGEVKSSRSVFSGRFSSSASRPRRPSMIICRSATSTRLLSISGSAWCSPSARAWKKPSPSVGTSRTVYD